MLGEKLILHTLAILLYRLLRIVSLFLFLVLCSLMLRGLGMLCWNVDFAIRLYAAFASLGIININ